MNLPGVIATGESARARHRSTAALNPAALAAEPEQRFGAPFPWHATRVISRRKPLSIYRVRPIDEAKGPGCYALKTLSPDWSKDRLGPAMLRREAAVAGAVNHANLVSVLDSHTSGDAIPHLILPYLEGVSLRRLLSNRREDPSTPCSLVPIASAIWFARQAAAALAPLHAAGWLHGQIRPEHLLISPSGQLTVVDLSQCRRLGTNECDAVSTPPESPIYSAPEAFSASQQLTAASDIYALGVVLFELLAGAPPFIASDPAQLAHCHRRAAPQELRQSSPHVSRETSLLVMRTLAKEPLRRPAAAEVA
jgi:serine/threonine-protein kinase